ncbi:Biopolymer transport protein ExbD/TolR [Candidatus Magnetomorum sp. HK-1]|nr:Biopolymer transport protein ExbD/TolR [Candidatus Magnetomorum sp. HK-1]
MRSFIKRRQKTTEDTEIDMVPVMNMFLVLIPFLLSSASFFDINAIHTSVPVSQNQEQAAIQEKDTPKTIIPVIEVRDNGIVMYALSDEIDAEVLNKWDISFLKQGEIYPLAEMIPYLEDMKTSFPKSDTLLIIPDENITYETIIHTMDIARNSADKKLFPNVVLSEKI